MSIFGAVEEVAAAGVVVGGLRQISKAQKNANRTRKKKVTRKKKKSKSRGR